MFDLQLKTKKNTKKPYPKEAKPGNKFIQDTTALHKTESRWNSRAET